VAHEHSYGATLDNNTTENAAVDFLLAADARFRKPSKSERKGILKRLELPASFSRAFDLVLLPVATDTDILSIPVKDLVLVELKTTRKKLVNNPEGFFFGATENEFNLADKLGNQYRFCFVSLHPESKGFVLLPFEELKAKFKTKRLQYQINL
jgi:hypothetical protein